MGKIVSLTKIIYGFKVHIVINERNSKMVNFAFSRGSEYGIHFLEKLLENCTGSEIGDSGYVSEARTKNLMQMPRLPAGTAKGIATFRS
jgi:hypothetical protein